MEVGVRRSVCARTSGISTFAHRELRVVVSAALIARLAFVAILAVALISRLALVALLAGGRAGGDPLLKLLDLQIEFVLVHFLFLHKKDLTLHDAPNASHQKTHHIIWDLVHQRNIGPIVKKTPNPARETAFIGNTALHMPKSLTRCEDGRTLMALSSGIETTSLVDV